MGRAGSNPRSPRRATATAILRGHRGAGHWFQSSIAPKGDRYRVVGGIEARDLLFQSSIAPKGDR